MNGDLVTQADLGGLLDLHERGRVRRPPSASGATCTRCRSGASSGTATGYCALEEKPAITRDVNTGIYALAPALVARVERDRRVDMTDLIDDALGRGEPVGAFSIEGDWIDVGQREQLLAREGGR